MSSSSSRPHRKSQKASTSDVSLARDQEPRTNPKDTTQPKPRYFRDETSEPRSRDAFKQLVGSLKRLINEYPPKEIQPGGGLYYGPVSIGYLFFVLQRMYDGLEIEGAQLGVWATAYLKQAENAFKVYPGPTTERCGVSDDVMALLAIDAASTRDPDIARSLCDFSSTISDPKAGDEWLYGRAGYLYLLRLVKVCFADDVSVKEMIDDAEDEVIEAIMDAPRPWKWHGKAYVGAVHGAVGIITQVVLTDASWAPELEVELAALLTYQYESGNWPSSIPPGRDRLVQVCHGAPGIIVSLLSIRKFFPKLQDKIDRVIEKGRACIKERGLLTKEACLCHGISGNALALEQVDFEHFLSFTTGHEMKGLKQDGLLDPSEDPASLWTGEAGRAWAWAVADKGLEKRLLGYNDV